MKIIALLVLLVIVGTYVYTAYRLYHSTTRIKAWELLLILLIPFWGCLIYLYTSGRIQRRSWNYRLNVSRAH